MSCGHVFIDRFGYADCHGRRGECRIEVIPASRDRTVVIATELQDNPGMSITNAAEYVATAACRELRIDPATLVWIEHYGYPSPVTPERPRTYDRVTFGRILPLISELLLQQPSWRVMKPADWRELGLEARS
jgi:hypothetical protein